uniref:Uncharacterized protein n=1 Tax=Octopus bimaculoides TaxID=37653 RepID=A0A0L8H3Q7_OCTBM
MHSNLETVSHFVYIFLCKSCLCALVKKLIHMFNNIIQNDNFVHRHRTAILKDMF